MNVAQTSWLDANQRYLWAALASVRTALKSYVQSMSGMAGDRLTNGKHLVQELAGRPSLSLLPCRHPPRWIRFAAPSA